MYPHIVCVSREDSLRLVRVSLHDSPQKPSESWTGLSVQKLPSHLGVRLSSPSLPRLLSRC